MKSIQILPTYVVPQLCIGSYQNSLTPEIIEHAYSSGIRLFNTSMTDNESEKNLGEWLKSNAIEDVLISTRIDTRNVNSIKDVVRYSLNRLGNTSKVIIHSAHMPVDNGIEYLREFKAMANSGEIAGFGVKTHDISVARQLAVLGINTIQLPVNIIEHKPFLELQSLLKENNITTIATNIFGGGLYANTHPLEFMIKSTLSLIKDNILCVTMTSKEQIDQVKAIVESYDPSEIYPIMQADCDNCQICNSVCMNNYCLSAAVRYSKCIKAGNDELKKWATAKLSELNISFDCVNCKRCFDSCPLKLDIKKFITSSF